MNNMHPAMVTCIESVLGSFECGNIDIQDCKEALDLLYGKHFSEYYQNIMRELHNERTTESV